MSALAAEENNPCIEIWKGRGEELRTLEVCRRRSGGVFLKRFPGAQLIVGAKDEKDRGMKVCDGLGISKRVSWELLIEGLCRISKSSQNARGLRTYHLSEVSPTYAVILGGLNAEEEVKRTNDTSGKRPALERK